MSYDRNDIESIVRKHQAMVFSIAYHFFNNAHIAEEVAQDVFLQLFEKLETIQSADHLAAWLRRTTSHRCVDAGRRKHNHHEIPMSNLPEVPEESKESDPLRDERLRALVASLPETPRMIVVLRYGQDMESTEIAAALNMPVATVRSHLQRAIGLLREKASGWLDEVKNGSL
jgi:RNA polymerase sigma-70 factor (ECF subfamily)